ncbi:hypothetical protein AB1Y20_015208 [Prymnesium parvum]|uniref:Protein kinase domain-containing protein n=1 Tax=Prymnesium parvum TaxID=97485 RepID=A0AB34JZR0_PRYPA
MSFGCTEDDFWLDPWDNVPLVKGPFDGVSDHSIFTDLRIIGGGSYSTVAQAVDARSGDKVAIKRVDQVFYSVTEAKKVLREIRLMRDFCHPNVLSLREILEPADTENFSDVFFILDYMDSDLEQEMRLKRIDPVQVCAYMSMMLHGLEHIHGLGGVHRDMKPSNILVTDTGLLRLCDFGLARTLAPSDPEPRPPSRSTTPKPNAEGASRRSMSPHVVTRWYRAPEVLMDQEYDTKLDMWSAGCIFKEMIDASRKSRVMAVDKKGKQKGPKPLFPGGTSMQSIDRDNRSMPRGEEDADNSSLTSADQPDGVGTKRRLSTRSLELMRHERHGQLARIFKVLGIPTEQEISWASPEAVERVLVLIRALAGSQSSFNPLGEHERERERINLLERRVPEITELELDLLGKLLSIDPRARPSATDALNHNYFEELPADFINHVLPTHVQKQHKKATEAAFKFEQQTLTTEDLRAMIRQEILFYTEEPKGRAAMVNKALQVARRLRGLQEPWLTVLPEKPAPPPKKPVRFRVNPSFRTSLASLAATGKLVGDDLDSRMVTTELIKRVFNPPDDWDADPELIDLVLVRGSCEPGQPVSPEKFKRFCWLLLRGMDKFLVKLSVELRYAPPEELDKPDAGGPSDAAETATAFMTAFSGPKERKGSARRYSMLSNRSDSTSSLISFTRSHSICSNEASGSSLQESSGVAQLYDHTRMTEVYFAGGAPTFGPPNPDALKGTSKKKLPALRPFSYLGKFLSFGCSTKYPDVDDRDTPPMDHSV